MTDTHPGKTRVCIVGGGPAGIICAYLLARQDIEVVLLEGEPDFDREFRGDTLHASSMEILEQLGHARHILSRANSLVKNLELVIGDRKLKIADFSTLKTPFPYIALIPQDRFIDYMVTSAKVYPAFRILMNARVHDLVYENDRVNGVIYKSNGVDHRLQADLVIGADGRGSTIRRLAGMTLEKTAPPMDVLWFKLPVLSNDTGNESVAARIGKGHMLISIDRKDHFQIGFVIIKGSYKAVREAGITSFQNHVVELMPHLAGSITQLNDWNQVSILSVVTGRVGQWYRDGCLLIGDAAHVMSPVGGVGINYAIQDAVATGNLVGEAIRTNRLALETLQAVQTRREPAVKFIQNIQTRVQQQLIKNALVPDGEFKPPLIIRIVALAPFLQRQFARLLAYGTRHEQVNQQA